MQKAPGEEGFTYEWTSLRVRNTFLEVDVEEQESVGSLRRSNSLPSNYSSKDSETSSRSHGSPDRNHDGGAQGPSQARSSRARRDEANVPRLPLVLQRAQEDPLDAPQATDPAWFVARSKKSLEASNKEDDLDETEEQFLERVGLSAEQMLADALHLPDHWSLRDLPTAQPRSHLDGTCVPCYFHFQSKCLFGDKCGCCHEPSHRNYETLRRFSRSSKIQL
mmetsp:Transcript_80526/g.127184  ORF Transcript_80526/g.127184 Transcript_80526/m.127184 type:complete len:221 (-) Transcript_80526:10-672(-)